MLAVVLRQTQIPRYEQKLMQCDPQPLDDFVKRAVQHSDTLSRFTFGKARTSSANDWVDERKPARNSTGSIGMATSPLTFLHAFTYG